MKNKIYLSVLLTMVVNSCLIMAQPIKKGTASLSYINPDYITLPSIDISNSGLFDVSFNVQANGLAMQCFDRSYSNVGVPNFSNQQLIYNNPSGRSDFWVKTAVNDNGNYVVVYAENNNNFVTTVDYCSIYIQKYNSNGTKNGSRIFVDYGMFPEIDMADDGTFNIVYQSGHYYSIPSVYVKRYNSIAAQVGVRLTIVTSASFSGNRNVAIRSQANNAFVVCYYGNSANTHNIVRYNSNGASFGGTISIGSDPSSFPNFIVKPNGDLVVLSCDAPVPNFSNIHNYRILKYSNGITTPTSSILYYSGSSPFYWSIGANGSGNYVICYPNIDRSNSLGPQVVQEFDVNDNKVGPEYPLSEEEENDCVECYSFYGSVDVSVSACKFAVAWISGNSSNAKKVSWETFIMHNTGVIADAGPNKSITASCCMGCNITTLGTLPLTGYTYSWSPTTYMTPVNGQVALPTITHPGGGSIFYVDYTVIATSGQGCSASDVARVFFNACRIQAPDEFQNTEFVISPNPSNGIFYINWGSELSKTATLDLYNVLGSKKIKSIIIYSNESNEIDLTSLQNGIYYCRLMDNDSGKSFTEKIIIN